MHLQHLNIGLTCPKQSTPSSIWRLPLKFRPPCLQFLHLIHHSPHLGRHGLPLVCVARSSSHAQPPQHAGKQPQQQQQQQQQQQKQESCGGILAPAFHSLGVDPACLPGLVKLGITEPSAIQKAAVQQIIGGANVAIQSYTGSGKTLAYLLPAITLALRRAEAIAATTGGEIPVQALIVAPNQELAMQIMRVARSVLPDAAKKMVQQCIGGANINNQLLALERNRPIIVVGTPGRLAQLMRMGALRVHRTPLLVLDEADQLLAPHFTEDMYNVTTQAGKRLGEGPPRPAASEGDGGSREQAEGGAADAGVPHGAGHAPERQRSTRQTVMASATLTETVLTKTAAWCPSPSYTTAGGPAPVVDPAGAPQAKPAGGAPEWGWGLKGWDGPASTAVGPRTIGSVGGVEQGELVPAMPPQLTHMYIVTHSEGRKAHTLRRAIHALDLKRVLVFMNFQQRLKDFQFKLEASKLKVATLHGELSKVQRANILNNFRRDRLRILMVSDLVARGLDVANCDAVFNAELPSSAAHYAHRAGRTGRMGAPGTVISLVTTSDVWVVEKLARRLGVPIQEVHVANGKLHPGPPAKTEAFEDAPSASRGGSSKAKGDRKSSSPPPAPVVSSSSSSSTSFFEAVARKQQTHGPTVQRAEHEPSGSSRGKVRGVDEQAGSLIEAGPKLSPVDDYEVIVDDEDELEVDKEGEWEVWDDRGAGGRGRRGKQAGWPGQRPAAPAPKSRAAMRALKSTHKLHSNSSSNGDSSSSMQGTSRPGSRLNDNSNSNSSSSKAGSSKIKEELMRELAALRAEKELLGLGGKGRSGGLQKKAKSSS